MEDVLVDENAPTPSPGIENGPPLPFPSSLLPYVSSRRSCTGRGGAPFVSQLDASGTPGPLALRSWRLRYTGPSPGVRCSAHARLTRRFPLAPALRAVAALGGTPAPCCGARPQVEGWLVEPELDTHDEGGCREPLNVELNRYAVGGHAVRVGLIDGV